jgi:hypothetical protein
MPPARARSSAFDDGAAAGVTSTGAIARQSRVPENRAAFWEVLHLGGALRDTCKALVKACGYRLHLKAGRKDIPPAFAFIIHA